MLENEAVVGHTQPVKRIACKVCRHAPIDEGQLLARFSEPLLASCPRCGFVFSWEGALAAGETAVAAGSGVFSGVAFYDDRAPASSHIWEAELDRVERYRQGDRLLDVGCGTGRFLEVARRRGFSVCGVEPNPDALETIRKEAAFEAHASLDELSTGDGRFDVITILHTLEHVEDPGRMLERCRSLLADRGVLVVTVPAFNPTTVRIDRIKSYTGWALVHRGHLNYFNRATLAMLLHNRGYSRVHQFPGLFGAFLVRKLPRAVRSEGPRVLPFVFATIAGLHALGLDLNITYYAWR